MYGVLSCPVLSCPLLAGCTRSTKHMSTCRVKGKEVHTHRVVKRSTERGEKVLGAVFNVHLSFLSCEFWSLTYQCCYAPTTAVRQVPAHHRAPPSAPHLLATNHSIRPMNKANFLWAFLVCSAQCGHAVTCIPPSLLNKNFAYFT